MPTLSSRKTNAFEESYSDRGTGSKKDLSVWRPLLFDDEYRTVYTATNSRTSPNEKVSIVTEGEDSDGTALATPVEFECVWTDSKTGGNNDGQLWRAICPANYKALSDVAIHQSNSGLKPGTMRPADKIDKSFRCVHEILCQKTELSNLVWTDKGSGGRWSGDVWNIQSSLGMRVSLRDKNDKFPLFEQYRLNAFTGNLYKNMKLVFSVENPDFKTVQAKYKLDIGLSFTKTVGTSEYKALETSISTKASTGVEGIVSGEVPVSFKAILATTTSFFTSETSTKLTTTEISYKIPHKKKVELWQLQVTDDKFGEAGQFNIKSNTYMVKVEDL